MIPAIEIRGLTKAFGATAAVDGLDLRVEPGEVYGFLGRNGAGKTTTIRMLLGMMGPDRGEVRLFGQAVRPNHGPWARVGSLVEAAAAWPELTVRENLATMADYHGLRDRHAVPRVLDLLDLGPLADRRAGHLSLGNLQRLALALALLPSPDLLVLDEPTNGLDPAGVVQIRELLVGLARDRGTTVFVSSHLLDEVARTCTRIGILHQGKLVEELAAADLDRLTAKRLVVETPDPEAARRALEAAGITLTRVGVESEDLEEYFLRRTGGL